MHTLPVLFWRGGRSAGGLLALAACLLASCAANKTASRLAGTTISELTAYEKSVEDKINAEEGFYRAQAAKLTELQGYSVLPKAEAGAKRAPGQRAASV